MMQNYIYIQIGSAIKTNNNQQIKYSNRKFFILVITIVCGKPQARA